MMGWWLKGAALIALVAVGAFYFVPMLDKIPFLQGMLPLFTSEYGFDLDEVPDLSGKSAIVTGGNTGIGFSTAKHLATKGASTIIACRTVSKCQAAADKLNSMLKDVSNAGMVTAMELDLASLASVKTFAQTFQDTQTAKLDILVLNAGTMWNPFTLSKDGIELQFATNHVGHFYLTELLLNKMNKYQSGPTGRIVVVTSAAQYLGYSDGVRLNLHDINDEGVYDREKAYGQSKLSNMLYAQELARRNPNLCINAYHPGAVATELSRHLFNPKYTNPIMGKILWLPDKAAVTAMYLVSSDKVCETGKSEYYVPIARVGKTVDHAKNQSMQSKLWEFTEEIIARHT